MAACALLLEIAHADEVFQPEERERIARHIREEMHVSGDELQEVFRIAEEERRESVDLFHFTQLLRDNLSREQRLRLVEAIWGVVYSDGSLSEVEGHLARKIAELLGFSTPKSRPSKRRWRRRSKCPRSKVQSPRSVQGRRSKVGAPPRRRILTLDLRPPTDFGPWTLDFGQLPQTTRGSRTVKVVPSPRRLATSTCPLCASTIHFTMESPRPEPPGWARRAPALR